MISKMTQGAFDISYGSIDKRFWNFDLNMTSLPDKDLAKKAVELINYENIILNEVDKTVFLKNKGMRIGFGGIGKGYAAECAKKILKQNGIESGIVNAAGDLTAWGYQENGEAWTIGIADPNKKESVFSTFNITNTSVATSGNYEKFVLIDGKKYSHTIDPKTGYPISGIKSVTIIAENAEIADALASGYYTVGNIDVGNIYSIYTSNLVEGSRFTVGVKTNWRFNKNIQLRGYVGATTRDKQVRYLLSSAFVLDRKQWSTLKFRYTSDIASSYDHDDELDQNSLFASILRRVKLSQTRLVNNREANIFYNKFFANGLGINAEAKSSELTPYFNIYYRYGNFQPFIVTKPAADQHYKVNQVSFTLRYAYREKFIVQHFRRGSLGSNYPIIALRYTKGLNIKSGILKSDFNYDKWEMNVTHDFSLGRLGQLSYILEGGITNGVLPILLLNVQKGNDTYYYNPYAFNNMNRYEFVADKYISLMLQHNFGSFPFNYLPGIKKFKWRSLFTFKGVYGDMAAANKIANGFYDNTIDYHFSIPNKTPYMETGVGIENIFRLLRIDAIWRLNYLQNKNVPRFGILGSIQFKF